MNENDEHLIMMNRINKWYNITEVVQIIFAIGLFIIFPLSSVISIILLIVMSQKTLKTAVINVVWHSIILFGYAILKAIQKVLTDNEGLTYLRALGNGRDLVMGMFSGYIGFMLIVDAALIVICIRACMYAAKNEELKKLDGYPYFYQRTVSIPIHPVNKNALAPQQNDVSEISSENTDENIQKPDTSIEDCNNTAQYSNKINVEIDSMENSEFFRCLNEMGSDIKNAIVKKPENFIDCSKIGAIIILLFGILRLHPASIFFAMFEFVFLFTALIYPNSKRIMIGFIFHIAGCILMLFAGNLNTNMFVYVFLFMINIVQTSMFYFAYRDQVTIEQTRRQEIKNKFEEEKEDRVYHAENNYDVYRSGPDYNTENTQGHKKVSLAKKRDVTMDEISIPENIVPDSVYHKLDVMDKIDI